MAHFRRSAETFSPTRTLKIIGAEYVEDHTVYIVEVSVGLYKWCVRHRYSDFHTLHEKLIQNFPTLTWSLLPKKKLFGTQTEQFVTKRQVELERYLQLLIKTLPHIPPVFTRFLDFHKYEVHGITETLAETLYENGDAILLSDKVYHLSPLQINAICTRLALPEPTCDSGDFRKDIGHLLDFVTRLKHLQIDGSTLPVGRSNVNMNDLAFDLHCFKSLTTLQISGCNADKMAEVEHLKKSLTYVGASQSLSCLKEVLLIGVGRGRLTMCDESTATLLVQPWSTVRRANFSNNRIHQIDESVKLLPHVELLDLSHNRLESIENLAHLSCLQRLILSNNAIRFVPSLHTKLGNVTTLDLSHNKLESLEGLAKLYSLEVLDISHNNVAQILDVRYVGNLPCLESLDLRGNAVTASLDYRTNVFEMFGDRAKEIMLDGARSTATEMDMVAVRLALNKSREAKRANRKPGRKVAVNEPTIADAEPVDSSGSPSSVNSRSVFPYPSTAPPSATPSSSETVGRDGASVSTEGAVAGGSATLDLRQKISHLQATGGACWLRQLNQLLADSHVAAAAPSSERPHPNAQVSEASSSEEVAEKNARSREITRFPLGHLERNLKRRPSEEEPATEQPTEPGSSRKPRRSHNFLLPETLPNSSDSTFCAHLQTLIPQRHKNPELDPEGTSELPIHIMWCTAILSRIRIETEFPGCIYITTDNVHVFNVRALSGDTGIPRLSRTLKLPLGKITRITVGHEGLYVLVEWASTEPRAHGVIAFLTFSSGKTDAFINSIKLAHRRSIPELDDYEDPNVVSSNGVETTLKGALNVFEGYSDPERIRVHLYLLVMVEGPASESSVRTSSLVITSNYIFLVRQDYCNTPLPSYVSSLPVEPVFHVTSVFPVASRIVTIQMYDIDTIESSNDHSLLSTFAGKPSPSSVPPVGFIGYGVRVSFHLGEYGIQVLDVRVPTSNLRERFLSTLVRVHSDVSDALSGSLSLRGARGASSGGAALRDMDNASGDSSGSQRSSSRAKGKDGRRRPNDGGSRLSSPSKQSVESEVHAAPDHPSSVGTFSEGKTGVQGTSTSGSIEALPVSSINSVRSMQIATQFTPQHTEAMASSPLNDSSLTHPESNDARIIAPESSDTSSLSGGHQEKSTETSAFTLAHPDNSNPGPSSHQAIPVSQSSEFKPGSPTDSQDSLTEFSRRLDSMGVLPDPALPSAFPRKPRSNSSQENVESWQDISSKQHSVVEAVPFDDRLSELDVVHLSGSLKRYNASQHSSPRSARSSIGSHSPSDLESLREDTAKNDSTGSLDRDEGAVLHSSQIVSETDIATVRLSVGDITLGDPTDFSSDISAAVTSSPKARSPEWEPTSHVAVRDITLGDPVQFSSAISAAVTSSPKAHLPEWEPASHAAVRLRPDQGRSGRVAPVSLPFQLGYPSNELLDHLSESFDVVPLFPSVSSAPLEVFMTMSGLELVNYFHQNIATISTENEELRHVLWTLVVPYTDPSVEIPSCVLLSTKAIYFVSDCCGPNTGPALGLRSHKRYASDSTYLHKDSNGRRLDRVIQQSSCHLSCGILSNSSFSERKRVLRSYATIFLKDLKQVNIGIFCQTIRLAGSDDKSVLACVTHSCQASEGFLNQLRTILQQFHPLPSPDVATNQDLEQDFYRMFSKPRSLDARQQNDARFVYPADDCISDITYLICRQLKGRKADIHSIKLLSYLLCFQVESGLTTVDVPQDLLYTKPRTLIVTEDHVALALEDHVSYPLPDFARMPPARPQMEIIEVRYLEFLQRITLHAQDAHVIVLTFTDETGEVIVDTSVDHFSAERGVEAAPEAVQEVGWMLLVQNDRSRDKLIRLISQQWEEIHRGRQLTVNTLP